MRLKSRRKRRKRNIKEKEETEEVTCANSGAAHPNASAARRERRATCEGRAGKQVGCAISITDHNILWKKALDKD
jgi:hypothetical protein